MAVENVSIALPVYNGAAYIRECIESVLDQDYGAWRLYVVDDASTDDTLSIVSSYRDPRISVSVNQVNAGPAENWNLATEQAQAPLFKLICQDDALEPGTLRRQVEIMEAFPDVTIVAGKRRVVLSNGRNARRNYGLGPLTGYHSGRDALRSCVLNGINYLGEPAAVLLRRSALPGPRPWRDESGYFLDFDVWSKVLLKGDFYGIDSEAAIFRVHARANSSTMFRDRQLKDAEWMFNHLAEVAGEVISGSDAERGINKARTLQRRRRFFYRMISALGYQ